MGLARGAGVSRTPTSGLCHVLPWGTGTGFPEAGRESFWFYEGLSSGPQSIPSKAFFGSEAVINSAGLGGEGTSLWYEQQRVGAGGERLCGLGYPREVLKPTEKAVVPECGVLQWGDLFLSGNLQDGPLWAE